MRFVWRIARSDVVPAGRDAAGALLPEAVRTGIVGMVRAFTGTDGENTANRQRDGGEGRSAAAGEQA